MVTAPSGRKLARRLQTLVAAHQQQDETVPSIEQLAVELQIRTIAHDFRTSVERKLPYRYEKNLPSALRAELADAPRVSDELNTRMQRLCAQLRPMPERPTVDGVIPAAPFIDADALEEAAVAPGGEDAQ